MSLNARTTALATATNLLIILTVVFVVAATMNPVAILGLFFLRELPLFQDSVNIEQLRQLGIIDGPGDLDDDDSIDSEYQGTKVGFTGRL